MRSNKVLDFSALKEEAAEIGQDAIASVNRFYDRCRRKSPDRRALSTLVNPWGEIKRLRAFIYAMREEEHKAARNALDLYAENELLRRYKDLADRGVGQFVTRDDHAVVQSELAQTKQKLASVSLALDNQHEAWMEYMKKWTPNKGPADGKY